MYKKRIPLSATLILLVSLPLWGGTGSPRDGFLSFILLLGLLLFILGILQLASFLKRKIGELLEDIY